MLEGDKPLEKNKTPTKQNKDKRETREGTEISWLHQKWADTLSPVAFPAALCHQLAPP